LEEVILVISMSAAGQNAKSHRHNRMSVLPPIATIEAASQHFGFGPEADISFTTRVGQA
jgi:hypothetical protein